MKMNRLYAFLTGAAALVLSCCGSGSSGETALTLNISPTSHMQVFSTDTYNSYLYLPQEYGADSGVTWPVIVYLHGYSEAGLGKGGLPALIESGKTYPFIILMPQSAANWKSPESIEAMHEHILALKDRYAADTKRIFLTGFSMGGDGTWALAAAHPELFAAIAPVSSFGLSGSVSALQNTPVWIFHGDADTVVPVSDGQSMYSRLAPFGNVKITILPGAGHQEAKNITYAKQDIYDWFLGMNAD